MAIVFALVLNFPDRGTADAAVPAIRRHPPVRAGRHRIAPHQPLIRELRGPGFHEVSVIPAGVGHGVGLDRSDQRIRLTADEFTELGHGLYALLATLSGYRAARVGWDPECFVDPGELGEEWAEELAAGDLPGLVLADDLDLGVETHGFTRFTAGYRWIPYRGETRSVLTAD